jgi:hypothetical protein
LPAMKSACSTLLATPEERHPDIDDIWLFLHLAFETIGEYRFIYRDLTDLCSRSSWPAPALPRHPQAVHGHGARPARRPQSIRRVAMPAPAELEASCATSSWSAPAGWPSTRSWSAIRTPARPGRLAGHEPGQPLLERRRPRPDGRPGCSVWGRCEMQPPKTRH